MKLSKKKRKQLNGKYKNLNYIRLSNGNIQNNITQFNKLEKYLVKHDKNDYHDDILNRIIEMRKNELRINSSDEGLSISDKFRKYRTPKVYHMTLEELCEIDNRYKNIDPLKFDFENSINVSITNMDEIIDRNNKEKEYIISIIKKDINSIEFSKEVYKYFSNSLIEEILNLNYIERKFLTSSREWYDNLNKIIEFRKDQYRKYHPNEIDNFDDTGLLLTDKFEKYKTLYEITVSREVYEKIMDILYPDRFSFIYWELQPRPSEDEKEVNDVKINIEDEDNSYDRDLLESLLLT